MPRVFEVSHDLLDWLDDAVERQVPYSQMAAYAGCCTDTIKRVLNRYGIVEFEGAKYAFKDALPTWSRPCNRCGDARPRPKWQYFCDACTADNNRTIDAVARERW